MMDPNDNREEQVDPPEGQDQDVDDDGGGSSSTTADEGAVDVNEMENVVNDEDIDMPYKHWASSIRPADEPLPENVIHVMGQVFQNDMLVEHILEKIILDNDRPSIRYCRLVSKQWLCAIAKLYRKMKRPLFVVNTNKDNSLLNEPRPRPFFEPHTLLYEFIKPMARPDRIEGFIPTFSLTLGASYFRKCNYTDFVNCLMQCGSSLVELYIRFPKNSAMSFLLPPTISLPNLNAFGVSFSSQALLGHPFPMAYHHQHDYFPNNCTIHLVQTILNATSNLRKMVFLNCPNPMNPPDMENLYLPDTLTTIHIDTPFRDFELLLRKNLPYLTEIRISATIALYSEETIYDLFSKLCPTLRTAWLTGASGTRRSLPIRLPRMEHLKKFVIFKPWEFEERNPPTSFEETFPVLETLVFANQTEYSFSYLMSGMRSTTVTHFCVWLTSLRPNPHVINFAQMGEDLPLPPMRHIHLEQVNLQERRERMRQALQQMRLDIMERHHRRMREVGAGEGGLVGVVHHVHVVGEQRPLPPPPALEGRGFVYQRPIIVDRRQEDRIGERRNDADIEIIRVVDDGDRRNNPYVRRARMAAEYRRRFRERHVNLEDPAGGREPALRPPLPVEGRYERVPRAAYDLGRIRNEEDAILRQQPRVVIRRIEIPRAGADRIPPPVPQNPAPEQNNVDAPVEGPARPEGPVRLEEQNPIRVVYQRLLNRMEVDREEDDNILHRVLENDGESGGEEDDAVPDVGHVEAVDDDSEDDDNDPGGAGGEEGMVVRRLQVLAAAAVAQRAERNDQASGDESEEDQGDPAVEVRPAADGQAEVNVAVREAFRIIRGEMDDDGVIPVPQQPPPRPLDGENNNVPAIVEVVPPPDDQPGPAPRLERNVEGEIRMRRRHRGEGRNLGHLRQLRHRMILDWANPRGNRPGAGAAPHIPLPERPVTMTKEKMQSINLAFPNLVKLTINISGPETCGLKYIFEEMRWLQSLKIIVENSLWTIKWDSLLTGIPQDFCDAVRSSTELWDEVYLNENHVSIRTMSKLQELMLLERMKVDEHHREQQRNPEEHFISDVAFHFGLLKMKELRHLSVTPGFSPSRAMYKKWYDEKGYKIKERPRPRLDLSIHE